MGVMRLAHDLPRGYVILFPKGRTGGPGPQEETSRANPPITCENLEDLHPHSLNKTGNLGAVA
jgi:hypothetical protein